MTVEMNADMPFPTLPQRGMALRMNQSFHHACDDAELRVCELATFSAYNTVSGVSGSREIDL